MKRFLISLLDIFYPRLCLVCKRSLLGEEKHICAHCLLNIPRTHFHRYKENPAEQLFRGKIRIEDAAAFFLFTQNGDYRHIIHEIKYHGEKECGYMLGAIYAQELIDDHRFGNIDFIVPVPLHKKKQRKRGYNQSEWIARGMADTWGKELRTDLILRNKDNRSQTNKSLYDRWLNTRDVFISQHAETLEGKHLLLVDDVITTGATLEACGQTLIGIKNIKISMIALAFAQ